MLIPQRVKHRKWHKGKKGGLETRGTDLAFGSYGLKALESYWLNSIQLEAGRRVIMRYLKKGGKFWIRLFPNKPVTKKGDEVSMGAGKGDVHHYVFPVKPGRIIFEVDGLPIEMAKEALRKASDKMPIRTKFVSREK